MASFNVRSGNGSGAGMGFRGGKGKPGYPLPDDMKNNIEEFEPQDPNNAGFPGVMESFVDDLVSSIASSIGVVRRDSNRDVVGPSPTLDVLAKANLVDLIAPEKEKFFFALKIPADVGQKISLPDGEEVVDLHVTVAYLKSVPAELKQKVVEIANELLAKYTERTFENGALGFKVKLGGIGRFSADETGGTDVIYASVDCPTLSDMQAELTMRLKEIGVEANERHGYSPHVTLKYVKSWDTLPMMKGLDVAVHRLEPIETTLDNWIIEGVLREAGKSKHSVGIGNVLAQNDAILKKHGYDVASEMGHGGRGIAFKLRNGKVLKITVDDTEARSSNAIKGKSLRHVAKIFDVFKFKQPAEAQGKHDQHYYGVVQELVTDMSESDKRDLDDALGWCGENLEFRWMSLDEQAVQNQISAWEQAHPGKEEEAKLAMRTLSKFSVFEMLDELRENHIDWMDLSSGNVMKRGNEFVAIDLGVSDSEGPEPDVIERVMENVITNLAEEVEYVLADDIKNALEADKELLKKRGITVGKEIGEGTRAIVFDIGGGKVLKVTEDETDALLALKIKSKNLKRMVKVFDVFKFVYRGGQHYDLYGIVMEKLTPLTGSELGPNSTEGEAGEFNSAYAEDDLDVLQKFNFNDIQNDLRSLGIRYNDWHGGNIMKRGDTFVLSDLGGSSVRGGTIKGVDEAAIPKRLDVHPVLTNYGQQLLRQHIKIGKMLGHGVSGVVFESGPGIAVKLTTDLSDAKTSNFVKGKRLKHIVKVFNVFYLPKQAQQKVDWYCVVEEKLAPLPDQELFKLSKGISFILNKTYSKEFKITDNIWSQSWEAIKAKAMSNVEGEEIAEAQTHFADLESLGFDELMKELKSNSIVYRDVHVDNFMKRGKDLVLVDLGGDTKSPGALPQRLESMELNKNVFETIRRVVCEARADKVAVTIGSFNPFHRGHADVLRRLASKFNKVVLIVDSVAPALDFDLQSEMIKKSLPDVMSKFELHEKSDQGQEFAQFVSKLVHDSSSTVEADTAVNFVVPIDLVDTLKQQLERLDREDGGLDPSLASVVALNDAKNYTDVGGVKGSEVKKALVYDNRQTFKRFMDPHLVSNSEDFEDVYAKLRNSALVEKVVENVINEIGPFVGLGNAHVGQSAGSSAVSSFKNSVDPKSKELWQNQLSRLRIFGSGSLPEEK